MFPIDWVEFRTARRTERLKIVVLPRVRQGRNAVRFWTTVDVVFSVSVLLLRWLTDIGLLFFRRRDQIALLLLALRL